MKEEKDLENQRDLVRGDRDITLRIRFAFWGFVSTNLYLAIVIYKYLLYGVPDNLVLHLCNRIKISAINSGN